MVQRTDVRVNDTAKRSNWSFYPRTFRSDKLPHLHHQAF